jgi:hypothetical protein
MTASLDQVPPDTVIGSFTEPDALVERLRERMAALGLSLALMDELTEMGEGSVGKYLSPLRVKQLTMLSLLKITTALALRGVLIEDPVLVAEMAPLWQRRDEKKAHASREACLGKATLQRVFPVVLRELSQRGNAARKIKLTPHRRKRIAQRAARARWGRG